jgi:hypothetical protein
MKVDAFRSLGKLYAGFLDEIDTERRIVCIREARQRGILSVVPISVFMIMLLNRISNS